MWGQGAALATRGAGHKGTLMRWLLTALLALCVTGAARGQCAGWLPSDGLPGPNGSVVALTVWDPDGAGPASPKLVVAGEFTIAGDVRANNIAAFDLETGEWSSLGEGVNGHVSALATLPNGDLIAGGWFNTAGGVPAARVARWNGSSWAALGSGVDDHVECLLTLPNGDLIAGGLFTTAGDTPASRIARWSGGAWSALGSGTNDAVYALAALTNGDVLAGGAFTAAGGAPASYVARFDAASAAWMPMGPGLNYNVRSLAVTPDGTIFAGGDFRANGDSSTFCHVARWTGEVWYGIGFSEGLSADNVLVLPNGDVVAGGPGVQRWDGASWEQLGSYFGTGCSALAVLPNGDIVAAGRFHINYLNTEAFLRVVRWTGDEWVALSPGFNDGIRAFAVHPEGGLVVGGEFTNAGNTTANGAAYWDGTAWTSMSLGEMGRVYALAIPRFGRTVAGYALFDGTTMTNFVGEWTGSRWQPIATDLNGAVSSLVFLRNIPNSHLIAAGYFTTINGVPANYIARWNGTTWSPLGSGLNSSVTSAVVLPNGDLVVAGWFTTAGGQPANRVARWNGATWSAMGSGMNSGVTELVMLTNGDLIAGGAFTTADGAPANHIARWNGAAWSSMGFPFDLGPYRTITALAALPGNQLAVGSGAFTPPGGVHSERLSHWDGATWSVIDANMNDAVNALISMPSGELIVGGPFTSVDGNVVSGFARYSFTGVPTVAATGLSGTGGPGYGEQITLSAAPANGYSGVSVQWFHDGHPVADGPGGASEGGGVVSGAFAELASPTDASFATLTIADSRPVDSGTYRAVFTNSCGSVATAEARVNVLFECPPCVPDYDQDGGMTGADLGAFFADFEAGGPCADIDRDGGITGNDVAEFFYVWEHGSC